MENSKIFEIQGEMVKIKNTITSYDVHMNRHGYSYSPLEIKNKQVYIQQLTDLYDHRYFQMNNDECKKCNNALDCMSKCEKI